MNGNTFDVAAPRFIVGTWDRLNGQQQRIFISYVRANFGESAPDPAAFARKLWNDSVEVANSGGVPGSDRLLDLSRLLTFIGITSMWEKCGVIEQVSVVTNINGDLPSNNFRLYGELADGGAQVVKARFKYAISGSGHGTYSVSRRERNFWREPNGQFSMTKDLRRFDSDVDYRSLIDTGHNTKANSDIRAFDGGSPHLQRHISRYGEVPITMINAFDPPADALVFVDSEVAPSADGAVEQAAAAIPAAVAAADSFTRRFTEDLTLGAGLFEEMFAADAILYIKATGFFVAVGLDEELVNSLETAELVQVYKQLMDFYYLRQLFTLRTEFLAARDVGEPTQSPPVEAERELHSMSKLGALADESVADSEVEDEITINTRAELKDHLSGLARAAEEYRVRLRANEGRPEIFRANVRSINAQKDNPVSVEAGESSGVEAAARNVYTVERGIFIVHLVEEGASMKVINLGLGN